MNKRELITLVQRQMGAGASRDAARAALNAVLSSILQACAEGEKVSIPQLGSFEYQPHRRRSGKGLPGATIAEERHCRRLSFRPAQGMKELAQRSARQKRGE